MRSRSRGKVRKSRARKPPQRTKSRLRGGTREDLNAYFVPIEVDCNRKKWHKLDVKKGQGIAGDVFVVCDDSKNCNYAMKIQGNGNSFKREVTALARLQGVPGVPKLYDAWSCEGVGYIVIELLEKCKSPLDKQMRDVEAILHNFRSMGYVHGDPHEGNVMCDKDGNVVLIDYGHTAFFPTPESQTSLERTNKGKYANFDDMMVVEDYVLKRSEFPYPEQEQDEAYARFKERFRPPYRGEPQWDD